MFAVQSIRRSIFPSDLMPNVAKSSTKPPRFGQKKIQSIVAQLSSIVSSRYPTRSPYGTEKIEFQRANLNDKVV